MYLLLLIIQSENQLSFSSSTEFSNANQNGVEIMENIWESKAIPVKVNKNRKVIYDYSRFKEKQGSQTTILETPVFIKPKEEHKIAQKLKLQNLKKPQIQTQKHSEVQAQPSQDQENLSINLPPRKYNESHRRNHRSKRRSRHMKKKEYKRLINNHIIRKKGNDIFMFGEEFKDMEDEILNKFLDNFGAEQFNNVKKPKKKNEMKRVFDIHNQGNVSPVYHSVSQVRNDNSRLFKNQSQSPNHSQNHSQNQSQSQKIETSNVSPYKRKHKKNNNHYIFVDDNQPSSNSKSRSGGKVGSVGPRLRPVRSTRHDMPISVNNINTTKPPTNSQPSHINHHTIRKQVKVPKGYIQPKETQRVNTKDGYVI